MRVALLALALGLALLASAARADQFADEDFDETPEPFEAADEADFDDNDNDDDEADEAEDEVAKSECPPDPKTEKKKLAGKEISQKTENISVRGRCVRVLEGGTPKSYTMAGNCGRCSYDGSNFHCVGSPLMRHMKCAVVLGPDCNHYTVDPEDHTKACS